jgi:hypothetical protein
MEFFGILRFAQDDGRNFLCDRALLVVDRRLMVLLVWGTCMGGRAARYHR